MTPEEEEKAKLNSMTDAELCEFLIRELTKIEAQLLLERSLERCKPQAMPKLEKVIGDVQESIRLTRRLLTGKGE